MVTVCTVLPPPERPRFDAAGDGCFTTVHTSSFRDALRAARRKRVDALVLSVHACRGDELPAVARFVREFPAIPAVALVSHRDRRPRRGGLHGARRLAPATGPGRPSGVTRRGPDSGAPRPRARRGDGRRARILRGGGTARAGIVHGAAAGAAPPDLLEYAHVPLLSGGPAVPEDLPRRHAARARGLPVLEPRALGGRRGVPPRLFVAAELRAPPEGDAGRYRG